MGSNLARLPIEQRQAIEQDMRRRLNIIRRNRMEIKNNEAGASHGKRTGTK
ncbi:MAG: hypothetical protein U5L02_06300 [Rheinheimera sp.]|nr:hypothetical protein [Rheinheimera sp.]